MNIQSEKLYEELKQLGVKKGMNLMVHSSMKRIGAGSFPGGAEDVIDVLLQSVGPEGNLLMPAISGTWTQRDCFIVHIVPSAWKATPPAMDTTFDIPSIRIGVNRFNKLPSPSSPDVF